MNSRKRDEQETRNTTEVMEWIVHLAQESDLTIDLDLICHINRLTLRKTRFRFFWEYRDDQPRHRLRNPQTGQPTDSLRVNH